MPPPELMEILLKDRENSDQKQQLIFGAFDTIETGYGKQEEPFDEE
jgi:hypothetical protein